MDQLFASLIIAKHYTPMPVDLLILVIGVALLAASVYRLVGAMKASRQIPVSGIGSRSAGGGWVSTDEDFFGAAAPAATPAPAMVGAASTSTGFTPWTPPTAPAARAGHAVVPPPRTSNGTLSALVLVIVGTLITMVGLTAFVPDAADAMSSHSVTLPQQTKHLVQIPLPPQLQEAVSTAESSLPHNVNVKNLQFGLYAKPQQQQPYAVAVVADIVGTPDVEREFAALTTSASTGSSLVKVTDNHHPGELRCGQMNGGANTVNVCLWIDEDTVGMLFAVDPHLGIHGIIDLGREFRAAAEQ
jgi:hypothetical protein